MEPTPTPDTLPKPPAEPSDSSPSSPSSPSPAPEPPAPDSGISQTVPRNDGPPPPPPFTPAASENSTPAPAPAAPAAAFPTVMVGDGGMAPQAPAGGPAIPDAPASPGGVRKLPKKPLMAVIAAVVILGGAAAWYFGYFMNSSVIYSQALKNTGKGYDKLVDFADKQEKLAQKGYTGSGTYKIKFGDFSTDGKVNLKGNPDDTELTFDVGLGVTRVNADIRTIKSSGDTPDVYVKAADIKGLGTVLGVPELDANLAKIDDTWIVIDHTFIDNVSSLATAQAQAQASDIKGPTRDQILDEARAFGKVNQEYVFSTSKDKAVTKVVKKYGIETISGHKTYHYKIALQKDNVKKYIYAQRDALKKTTLNDWLKKNKYDKDTYAAFDDAAKSTKDIKSSDTYDVWMDVNRRVAYKIRFNDTAAKNPAQNYVDVGLDYKGGDTFPFFISGKFKDEPPEERVFEDCINCGAPAPQTAQTSDFSFVTTIDTKLNTIGFKLDVKVTGNDPGTVSANFTFKPSDSAIKISKPSGAKPLSQVLSELGFGDVFAQYNNAAQDSKRKSDILTIQTQLEAFFQENGYYPSLADMNNPAWLAANMKSLDQGALTDPSGTGTKLAPAPAAGIYAYQVTNANGGSCEADDKQCAKYTLTATFPAPVDGQKTYSKSNLD